MSFISHFLGKKKPTAANLRDYLVRLQENLSLIEESIRFNEAEMERLLPEFRLSDYKDSEELVKNDKFIVKQTLAKIEAVKEAIAVAELSEKTELYERSKRELEQRSGELEQRVREEYTECAQKLAGLMNAIRDFGKKRDELEATGCELGRSDWQVSHPEAFRCTPERFSVIYPNPNGSGVIQASAEDAPCWTITWVEDKPVPARDDVRVVSRGRIFKERLTEVLNLPGLMPGEADFYAPKKPFTLPPLGPM